MPQMFHLALPQHGVGIAATPWDWAVGPNLGHLFGFFYPATDTFSSEFKLLVSMQLQQHFGQMLLHLVFVLMLNVPLFW